MSDGCRLAARIWLPADAEASPVPAILEYMPYRKNDGSSSRDAQIYPYFAGYGYATVRVDLRGSGDSDGILRDEYLPQEQDDAVEVLSWLANQSWCTGSVGVIGISWSGFSALQIAARRPPQLKAVVSVCSTDDRYADDVHYIGGSVLGSQMLSWATTMLAYNARPPDPAVVGESWRDTWIRRMDETPPFIETWLSHPRRDAYWRQGSVCENYDDIGCAVYMVGGWADAYSNSVMRFLRGYRGPRKGLIGPWSHQYPQTGIPGPSIGFLQECLRWWDYWLKGVPTGIMDEPMLRVWMQDSVPPQRFYATRPGRWVSESNWPSPQIGERHYILNDQTLDSTAGVAAELKLRGAQEAGRDAGNWMPSGRPTDLPPNQQAEDGLALSFDSAPLVEGLEILGYPVARLALASDRPCALVCVRLCDVHPDGYSTLVTRGVLNLTHRESHEQPAPLTPGERFQVDVQLDAIAYVFPPGHRIRLAISPIYWPLAWPSPEVVTLSTYVGGPSSLTLPARAPSPADSELRPFDEAEVAAGWASRDLPSLAPTAWRTETDARTESHEIVIDFDWSEDRRMPDGLEYRSGAQDSFGSLEGDPLAATARSKWTIVIRRGEWDTRVEASSKMTSTRHAFLVTSALEAYEHGIRIFTKTWSHTIPRDLN